MLVDNFGRTINYLRLAVTDRCNIRCQYCMPEKMTFLPKKEVLSYEELVRVVNLLVSHGINKVRITGGEPFVRKDLCDFMSAISKFEGLNNLHITSNGTLIEPHIDRLKEIGISSVNISLDTLNPQRFLKITRRDSFEKVESALDKLISSGIRTKINMVVMRGVNEEDIIPMAALAVHNDIEVRYIEEMPFNGTGETNKPIDHREIYDRLKSHFGDLNKHDQRHGETAQTYSFENGHGVVGIIAAHSRTFCGSCNRIRITPQGELINCLYDSKGLDMKTLIRNGIADSELISTIQHHIHKKHENGHIAEKARDQSEFQSMSLIGG